MRVWVLSMAVWLAGCASGPATLPEDMSPPAAECRWEQQLAGAEANEPVVAALEAQGFTIRDTNSDLGLVSAERTRVIYGYHRYYDPWPYGGWYGFYGLGSRHYMGGGIGLGFGTSVGGSAQRQERVSVVADGEWVQVSRDVRVVDIDGVTRESYTASDADFCRELRTTIDAERARESP
ncbi:hypothetical protein [Litchfieldella rifensis]|uniref:DUF4136 domain-containing protein n=1 Tax=Litchfieldella rifensis TaxID=762643 RepID=A0ABV7LM83_9GAMM